MAEHETFDQWFEAQDKHIIESLSKRAVACEAWHHIRRAMARDAPHPVEQPDDLRAEVERLRSENEKLRRDIYHGTRALLDKPGGE